MRLAALGLLALTVVGCKSAVDDFHPWGTFGTLRVRLGDTCRAVDGGNCFPAAARGTLTIGVHTGADGGAALKRANNEEVLGEQAGSRFLFQVDTADGGVTQRICNCDAVARETIWGELYTASSPEASIEDAGFNPACDGGMDGSFCAWWIQEPPCGTDPGLTPDGWLSDAGASVDLNAQYAGFRATLVDELNVAPGFAVPDGGCSCLPCRVTYQLSGEL